VSWRLRLADADRRAMLRSVVAAALAFTALAGIVDRFTRLAEARPLAEKEGVWQVPLGQELRLKGLRPGPLLGIEGGFGDGANLKAAQARLDEGGGPHRLAWLVAGGSGDHRLTVQLSLPGDSGEGAVVLRRIGEAATARLEVRNLGPALRVEAAVGIGESLTLPDIQYQQDGGAVDRGGPVLGFTLVRGGTLSVELPALGGDAAALGDGENDVAALGVREVEVAGGGDSPALRAACGASAGSYAVAAALRLVPSPVPTGADCIAGRLATTGLAVSAKGLAVTLDGSAYLLVDGKPTASFWSWAMSNPVLENGINKALPLAVSAIFGIVAFRRTSRPAEPKPKAKPKRRRAAA
jgi:hypothetical protein